MGQNELRQRQKGENVDIEHPLGDFNADFGGIAVLTNAGIVDEDVYSAEMADRLLDDFGPGFFFGDISGNDEPGGGPLVLEVAAWKRGQSQFCPASAEQARTTGTDSLGGSGNQDDLISQFTQHLTLEYKSRDSVFT